MTETTEPGGSDAAPEPAAAPTAADVPLVAQRAITAPATVHRAARTVEVVCHPGNRVEGDPALPASFGRMRVHELWEPEFRSLMEGAWQEAAAKNGWQLTSFDRL